MAPVVATTINSELASSAAMGMPTINEYRPLMGLRPARMAVAIASGMVTRATVMPAVRSAPRPPRPALALTGASEVVILTPNAMIYTLNQSTLTGRECFGQATRQMAWQRAPPV